MLAIGQMTELLESAIIALPRHTEMPAARHRSRSTVSGAEGELVKAPWTPFRFEDSRSNCADRSYGAIAHGGCVTSLC